MDADYSQIELRLLAHISGDEVMQQAFRSGEDIHTVTASQVFDVPPEEVTHQMRSRAKAVNFGIVYGISAFSLSQDIGVTVAEAKEYMERYFATYTGVRRLYGREVVEQAKAARLCRPPSSAGAGALPELKSLQLQPPLLRGAGGAEYAHPGDGGGHHEAGHDPGRAAALRRGSGRPADHRRSTMSSW